MKNKGFVMIETIVVVTILSVGLISLFTSYNLILGKINQKSNYDNVEYVYKTYFVAKYIKSAFSYTSISNGCTTYEASTPGISNELESLITTFKIEKIYLLKGTYSARTTKTELLKFDGTTIGYIRDMDRYDDTKVNIVIKFSEEGPFPNTKAINFASMPIEY